MRSALLLKGMAVCPMAMVDQSPFCMVCVKNEARWVVGLTPNDYVSCAECFLYESPWGKSHALEIMQLVEATEFEMGVAISSAGRLRPEHADRILASIVLTSRVATARGLGG